PNAWLDEEIVATSLAERLDTLVALGDAFVVLRGGIGTLLELALVWNLAQSRAAVAKPIIVVGPEWEHVLACVRTSLPMHPWEVETLRIVPTVDDAIGLLDTHFSDGGSPMPIEPR